MTFKLLTSSLLIATLGACANNPHKLKEIDSKIEEKGNVGGGDKLGINDNKEVVIQNERSGEDELRIKEAVNLKHEEDLKHEIHMLKRCRKDLGRLSGSAEVAKVPDVADIKRKVDTKEEFGINAKGEIKFVRRQFYKDRLEAASKEEETLTKMLSLTKDHREDCEAKVEVARTKAGLPGKRYEADGYFLPDGTWVEKRKGEDTVDDAFEIQAKAKSKAKEKAAAQEAAQE